MINQLTVIEIINLFFFFVFRNCILILLIFLSIHEDLIWGPRHSDCHRFIIFINCYFNICINKSPVDQIDGPAEIINISSKKEIA